MKYTEDSEPPLLYREWVAVSLVAAAMQRKCELRFGALRIYPNMYVVLVGPSGRARKGTAMGYGLNFLYKLGIPLAAEVVTREALIRELNNATSFIQTKNNITAHASLTIYSPELVVFAGKANEQIMYDLTDWFDCRDRWTYRVKHGPSDEIRGVWVNLIGATTPELIRTAFPPEFVGGGFGSRCIFVYEERDAKDVPVPIMSPATIKLEQELLEDLNDIYTWQSTFVVTEDFVEEYSKWYVHQKHNPPDLGKNFAGYNSRRQIHVLKLCMILVASEESIDDDGKPVLTKEIFERALDLLERTEVKMPRTFMGFGASSTSQVTVSIMTYIAFKGEVSRAQLTRDYFADVQDMRQLENIVAVLQNMGFCTVVHQGGKEIIKYVPGNRYDKQFRGGGQKP